MMRRVLAGLWVAAALSGGAARTTRADDEKPFAERVNSAIDRGVEWLRKRQGADGSWGAVMQTGSNYAGAGPAYDFPAGPTAFALYTLLKCGTPPDDPGVRHAFDALRRFDRESLSSYEIAATLLAVEAKYDQVKREAKREAAAGLKAEPGKRPDLHVKPSKDDAVWLGKLAAALTDRLDSGGWRYFRPNIRMPGAKQDTSSTAISMLALLAAHRCGVDVPRATTASVVQWDLAQQEATGPAAQPQKPAGGAGTTWAPPVDVTVRGWPYVKKSPFETEPTQATGNMTTAGMITLLAAQHVLEDTGPETLKPLQPGIDKAIADGTAWLAAHWRIDANPGWQYYHYMYLYGLERVGDLRRVALIAGHDWYMEGAKILVADQTENGSWVKKDTHRPSDLLNTCFALLFLDRASLAVTTPK
jgi:hypothetical protein